MTVWTSKAQNALCTTLLRIHKLMLLPKRMPDSRCEAQDAFFFVADLLKVARCSL